MDMNSDFEIVDVLLVEPKDKLGFCCNLSSLHASDPDCSPTAIILDEEGKKILGKIALSKQPKSISDFESVDGSIPESVLNAFFNYIKDEKNWNKFILEWNELV